MVYQQQLQMMSDLSCEGSKDPLHFSGFGNSRLNAIFSALPNP
jgi:hypothetical protein